MIKSVSLDNDVVESIEKQALEEERPFSQIVNRRLREALGIRKTSPRRKAHGKEQAA